MLKQFSPPLVCHVSQDTCFVLIDMCPNLDVTCHVSRVTTKYFIIFKELALSGPIPSISQNVRMSVCLFICLSITLSHSVYWSFCPTSQSPMSKLFRFLRPWGQVMERSGLRFENFCQPTKYPASEKLNCKQPKDQA